MNFHDRLSKALVAHGINLTEEVITKLSTFLELLSQWTKVHNLTAILDPQEMVDKHILDSLSVLPLLQTNMASKAPIRVLDVGSGAGLPGIPLALCLPNHQFVLLDKNQKKVNFIEHVILSLKLHNVSASRHRVESYHPPDLFDWVLARAFASLSDFVTLTAHLTKKEGRWLAMKGKLSLEELAALPIGYTIEHKVDLSTVNAQRTLIVIQKE